MPHAIMGNFRRTKLACQKVNKIMDVLIRGCSIDARLRTAFEDSTFEVSYDDDIMVLSFDFAPTVDKNDDIIMKVSYDLNKLVGNFSTKKESDLMESLVWEWDRFRVMFTFFHNAEFETVEPETIEEENKPSLKKGDKK